MHRTPTVCARRPHVRRQPLSETLESRTLLAGNVTAVEAAGLLTIQGDLLGNQIKVYSGYHPGEVYVKGENGTLVNGSFYAQKFQGVENIEADMGKGNDTFKADRLYLTGAVATSVFVNGGTGDDCILFYDSTIRAEFVSVTIVGESLGPGETSSGNDVIELCNTTLKAEGASAAVALAIAGEENTGGTVTGGNDRISLLNSRVAAVSNAPASDGLSASTAVNIFGDLNSTPATLLGLGDSTVGIGNDCITLSCTDVTATSAYDASTLLQIVGDSNSTGGGLGTARIGRGDDTISLSYADVKAECGANANAVTVDVVGDQNDAATSLATARVGGGNDSISFSHTDVAASGPAQSNSTTVTVTGDRNAGFVALGTAEVGEGNDCISFCDTAVTATGSNVSNSTFMQVSGEENQVAFGSIGAGNDSVSSDHLLVKSAGDGASSSTSFSVFADGATFGNLFGTIGGGRDDVSLKNTDVIASGGPGLGSADAQVYGDDAASSALTTVGDGDDCVTLSCFRLIGDGAANLQLHTAKGCDVVEVRNSQWGLSAMSTGEELDADDNDDFWFTGNCFTNTDILMGGGDDELWFVCNTFDTASADGGLLFFDKLHKEGNTGLFTHTNFEQVTGS